MKGVPPAPMRMTMMSSVILVMSLPVVRRLPDASTLDYERRLQKIATTWGMCAGKTLLVN